ncbi:uncharacterized protein LOC134125095 isoform X1 [Pungitius pungitius]|uniref:uncharacterized protein LOC134125095 isoform X1 n=1 Tax=Pungitius pungitius TaxID=134920 RepID=UPI002E132866
MYCDVCGAESDATITCEIKRHPEVLMLLLKRFEFDYQYMTYVKSNLNVKVPFTLQIPENQTYELYAVVDHFGDLRSGHYTATIRSQDDGTWYRFDDRRVSSNQHQPFEVDDFETSSRPYLLLYRMKKVQAADTCTQGIRETSTAGGVPPATNNIPDDGGQEGKHVVSPDDFRPVKQEVGEKMKAEGAKPLTRVTENRGDGRVKKFHPSKATTALSEDTVEGRRNSKKSETYQVKITEEETRNGVQEMIVTNNFRITTLEESSEGSIKSLVEYDEGNAEIKCDPNTDAKVTLPEGFFNLQLNASSLTASQKRKDKKEKNEMGRKIPSNAERKPNVSDAQEPAVWKKPAVKDRAEKRRHLRRRCSPLKKNKKDKKKEKQSCLCLCFR